MNELQKAAEIARDRWAEPLADRIPGNGGRLQRAAQSGSVIAVVVIGVVALVGLLIFDQVRTAVPESALENDDGTSNQFGDSVSALVDGFGNAIELVPIVLLVLIAALVIGVVQRMRGSSGGM